MLNFIALVHEPQPYPIKTLDDARNLKIEKYTKAEFALYDECVNSAEEFAKHASFWREIANPDGTVNSAYGHLIWKKRLDPYQGGELTTPWEWAYESLRADKDTRQAFVRFSRPEHQWFGNKDQVCTMHGQFMIRENQLHFTIVMRSNDVVKGLVYDMPWFCSLIYRMRNELAPYYPGLQIGVYTHFVHSLHLYERDLPIVYKMLGMEYAAQG